MIPEQMIIAWRQKAPWQSNAQVEQDLILSRILVEIFSDAVLNEAVIFRGGTALHKLFVRRSSRYSEDVDLVQKTSAPIGPILDALRNRLDSWLGEPKRKQKQGRVTLYYSFLSEIAPIQKMRIKIEINTREHFHYLPIQEIPFDVDNRWFQGKTHIRSYALEELLGTKLRALYQRKKGRDLFDLYVLLEEHPTLNPQTIIQTFQFYMEKEDKKVSRAEFEQNMEQKISDRIFLADIYPLLRSTDQYDPLMAYEKVHQGLLTFLPGDPFKTKKK